MCCIGYLDAATPTLHCNRPLRHSVLQLQMSVDDAADDDKGGVAGEIFSRHRRSAQPESQQVCAALPAHHVLLWVTPPTAMIPTAALV